MAATAPAVLPTVPDMANFQVKVLTPQEYNVVKNYMTNDFLAKFGTRKGYGLFCKMARQVGWVCGEKNGKESYATYLKNSKAPGGGNLLQKAISQYNEVDQWTQLAAVRSIDQGRKLLEKAPVSKSCLTKVAPSVIQTMADAAGVNISGLTKLQACAALTDSPTAQAMFPDELSDSVTVMAKGGTGYKKFLKKGVRPKKALQTWAGGVDYKANIPGATDTQVPMEDLAPYLRRTTKTYKNF